MQFHGCFIVHISLYRIQFRNWNTFDSFVSFQGFFDRCFVLLNKSVFTCLSVFPRSMHSSVGWGYVVHYGIYNVTFCHYARIFNLILVSFILSTLKTIVTDFSLLIYCDWEILNLAKLKYIKGNWKIYNTIKNINNLK